jgi:uncharacterized protein (TIGR02246 family)
MAGAVWLAFASPSFAQAPADEINAMLHQWAAGYGSASSAADMLGYYDPDAVFWGTGGRQPFASQADIEQYFAQQFASFPTRKVSFIDPVIRVYGQTATATGLYKFEVATALGEALAVTHRYSFAYVKTDAGWIIIHQHSSQLP